MGYDNTAVIIVAGGSGRRMGGDTPKQLTELEGVPVLVRTVRRFLEALPSSRIIIPMNPQARERWEAMCDEYSLCGTHILCEGGATRFESVRNALAHTSGCDYIAVHDGVRPLVSVQTILGCLRCAVEYGTAIPVVEPPDSLRITDGELSRPLDRSTVRLVQTPQVFFADLLREAYRRPCQSSFTDDGSVVEAMGIVLRLCPGERSNIKITHPADMAVAATILKNEH